MEADSVQSNEERHGRVTRVPFQQAEQIQRLAEDAGLPFSVVVGLLLERSLDDAPTWLQAAADERRERQERRAREQDEVAI